MCGIFGYVGTETALGEMILAALRTLEYRGYDSWGVAVGIDGHLNVEKRTGQIKDARVAFPPSGIGFGHTRWATHGGVTDRNAHPHLDCDRRLAVIHNGIIENFRACREGLTARGHQFTSDTDSEVVAHLLEEALDNDNRDLAAAMAATFGHLTGLNAVIALDVRRRELVAAKTVSPLVVGLGPRGTTIASDALALQGHADRVCYLDDDQLVRLRPDVVALYDRSTMREIAPTWLPLPAEVADTGLRGYPHFMAKEMAEQPAVLERLVNEGTVEIERMARAIETAHQTYLLGCGSAAYAALTGSALFRRVARQQCHVIAAAEFAEYADFLTRRSLVVALSQSGETADVLAAMLAAQAHAATLGALLNAPHSTLDRMVDLAVHLRAGPERCVLATKSYTAKVAALLLLAHVLAGRDEVGRALVRRAAAGLREMLAPAWQDRVRDVARRIQHAEHLFVIGRGLAYPTALEAALKIKEVSYLHAEGLAGGELKHGVIALITEGTPCLVYAPADETRTDMLSAAMELKSRGALIIGVGPEPDPVFDHHLPTPDVGDAAPLVHALPAQLLGYELALLCGHDPDKPRNLAKSVTVK